MLPTLARRTGFVVAVASFLLVCCVVGLVIGGLLVMFLAPMLAPIL